MKTTKSEALFAEAKKCMPGGVNSPVRAFQAVGRTPLFIEKAVGDRIFDADGNEFIDYVMSWGPGILGHARPEVVSAVKQACENGLTFGAPTAKETELAERMMAAMPELERIRLVNSGTESVMSAVRAARGYTGRDLIVKFAGCYHGHSDGLLVKAGSGLLTNAVPDSAGVPKAFSDCTLVAEYNDRGSVEQLFTAYGNQIAALIVEPVAANMGVVPPAPGFLSFLRSITKKYGTVLIFDEVITGFRLAPGGACQYYNVRPDMVTLGKIIGGGMPLAAYGGRKEIMETVSPDGPVYQAGTLSGNPVAVTAGIETLRILADDPGLYDRLEDKGALLQAALQTVPGAQVNRAGSLMSIFFTDKPVTNYQSSAASDAGRFAEWFSYLLDHGVYAAPSRFEAMFLSNAHTAEDIAETCMVFRRFGES